MPVRPRIELRLELAFLLSAIVAALFIVVPIKAIERSDTQAGQRQRVDGETPGRIGESTAAIDTFVVAEFDFDATTGGPDPQGWTTHDLTDEPLYFHVDDFTGMPAPYLPLAGSRSLWLGARASSALPYCAWAILPGYGNNWTQEFRSTAFAVSGDVDIEYTVRWDSEAGYDYTLLQYRSTADWVNLPVNGGAPLGYDGSGTSMESLSVPAAGHAGSIEFRFLFISDGGVSDEDPLLGFDSDGAVVIDDLVVSDGTGVVDSQDFESEAVGATATADGDWSAGVAGVFGEFANLFAGTTVVQEDPVVSNSTYLWGFFDNSPDDYGCGGFPGQPSVPVQKPGDLPFPADIFISNEARSPILDVTQDENGTPMPLDSPIFVTFDVYRDMPLDTGVRYLLHARGFIDGCTDGWRRTIFKSGDEKRWFREQIDISSLVSPNSTEIQIGIVCFDHNFFSNTCHSHAPLFDNVVVTRVFDPVTGAAGPTPPSSALFQNHPNPFNPTTTITFVLEERARVSLRVYDTTGALVRTLIDEERASGPSHRVDWDGRDDAGRYVASGIYFYRIVTPQFTQARKMVLLK